uniref:U5 small nuclear ribonucleoprotein 40 kDa protein n=1 Tax=Papio anubis TaxID=9555 RepID=A0A2I3LC37_PAPAN
MPNNKRLSEGGANGYIETDWFFQAGSCGGRTKLEPIAWRLRGAARSVAALKRPVAAMIEQQKRKGPELPLVPVKRQRHELLLGAGSGPGAGQQQATPGALLQAGPPRCSSLQAPIMLLSGHEGEVYCCKFHPNGSTLASAGFDRLILLWNVYGDCDNYATLKGHSGAVMELHYNTDGSMLFSASTDKTVAVWDSETGERVKRLKGHTSFVNSCYPARRGPQLVCTGSDDGTVKLWDIRKKAAIQTFQNTYQVLAVTFNDTSDQIISGGIDNDIKVWDLRQNKLTYTMRGHADSVTGLSLSSEGSYLLSNAMDNTVRVWDVRPFAPKERCVKIFQGNVHNFEKLSQHRVTRDCIWERFSEDMEWKTPRPLVFETSDCITDIKCWMPRLAPSLQMTIASKKQEAVAIFQKPLLSDFTRMTKKQSSQDVINKFQKNLVLPDAVAHACNPNTWGGQGGRIT